MIVLTLILSIMAWAAWIGLTVWLGPYVAEHIHPYMQKLGEPQAWTFSVWLGCLIVAAVSWVAIGGAWAAF